MSYIFAKYYLECEISPTALCHLCNRHCDRKTSGESIARYGMVRYSLVMAKCELIWMKLDHLQIRIFGQLGVIAIMNLPLNRRKKRLHSRWKLSSWNHFNGFFSAVTVVPQETQLSVVIVFKRKNKKFSKEKNRKMSFNHIQTSPIFWINSRYSHYLY